MPLGDEDLKFVLTVDPDTAKMQAALKDIGKEIDEQAKQAKISWDALGKAGAAQLDSIRAHQKFSDAFAPKPDAAVDARAAQMAKITAEMNKQRELLERINVELDPKVLKERVALERELSEARAAYVKAHDAESVQQSPPQSWLQKLTNLGGAGLNLRQLGGAAIGGALGGGAGGGIGAAAGGILGGGGLGAVASALGPIGVAAGIAAGGLLLVVDGLKKITETVASFVAVASPGTYRQWELTLRDISGVIGQSLTPVLKLMTEAARIFGDTLANILPNAQEIDNALSPLSRGMHELGDSLKDLWSAIGPGIRALVDLGIKDLALEFYILGKALEGLVNTFRTSPLGWILRGIGYAAEKAGITGGGNRSSFGAAARPAHFSGIEEYAKEFQTSALSASTMQSIPQKQLTTLEEIRDLLKPKQANVMDNLGDGTGIRRAILGY